MKEERYFLVPDAMLLSELPEEEAQHAARVLRLKEGDEIMLIDGEGSFHRARLTAVTQKGCTYEIIETKLQKKGWHGRVHLAIAPTKKMERMEWMAEKCTEIGFDVLTFLECQFSERRSIRTERIEKIVASAVKQSRKPFVPVVNELTDFAHFVVQPIEGKKYICHCHEEVERTELLEEFMELAPGEDVTILIGPEGDFSTEEVWKAINCGYKPVTLGTFRLRTETAGVMAISMYSLANRNKKAT